MVALADVLVHVCDESVSGHALEMACLLSRQHRARLTAVLVAEPVHAGLGLSPETAALALQVEETQRRSMLALGERLVQHVQQRHGLVIDIRQARGDTVEVLLTEGRAADVLITSQPSAGAEWTGLSNAQAARLLVGSSCPVLTVPSIGWRQGSTSATPGGVMGKVLVAWSDASESARAVRDALPLLQAAQVVELCSFSGAEPLEMERRQASLDRLVSHLAQHGVAATKTILHRSETSMSERMSPGWVPDVSIAQALLSHAADRDADLIVMGGYGHSRLREWVLGGVTRSMLQTMTVPVLMSH